MIYLMHPDYTRYSVFSIDYIKLWEKFGDDFKFHLDPTPISHIDKWQPFEISFHSFSNTKKSLPVPDIMASDGLLFLNQKAYLHLHKILKQHGDFLPVTYQNTKGYFFEILSTAEEKNSVNQKLSVKNIHGDVESLAFIEEKLIDTSIFRTEFNNFMCIYCQHAVKSIIEAENLKGVTFSIDLGNIFPPSGDSAQPANH